MPNPDSYEIAVNWNHDGSTFVDESGNTKEFVTFYGRQNEFAPPESGGATVILGNEDGRFTPEYSSSPLYGDLEPGRRIRIKATQTPTAYDLFNGYITRIVPDPVAQIAALECEDASRYLRDFHLNLALAEDKLSSDRVTAILDAVGIAGGDRDIATGQTTFPSPYWRNVDAFTALAEIAYNELGGLLFVAPDGKITFQDRHYRPKHALDATITRATGMVLEYERRDDQVYKNATLQAAGVVEGVPGSQIWSLFPLPEQIAAGATLELPINYATPAKDVISPVSGTDYSATANQDGTGTDRTSDLSVVTFDDYGGGAQWDIQNTGSSALWLQRAQIRGTPLQLPSHLSTVTRTASGSTSPFATSYVPAGFGLITDRVLLGSYAEYIVNRYKTPQPLLRLTLQGATAALLTQMLSRQVSDRVKITDTGPAWVSHVDDEFFIERVEHRMATDDETGQRLHETSWVMSNYLTDQFGVLDTSKLDVDAVLGF